MAGAADDLRRVAEASAAFARDWPRHGADVAADVIDRGVKAATGGDGRFSNAPGVRADVVVTGGSGQAEVAGRGAGMTWLEEGTKAHRVRARPGRFLRTPYGPRRVVDVSGMPAKRTWSRGVDAAMPVVERDADAALAKVVG